MKTGIVQRHCPMPAPHKSKRIARPAKNEGDPSTESEYLMNDIEWADPPGARAGNQSDKYGWFAAELVKNPGRWAVLRGEFTALASVIKSGQRCWGPQGTFEAVCRNTSSGRGDVYVRCIDPEVA